MSEQLKPCELPCPKCGHDEISRRYFATSDRITSDEYGKQPSRYTDGHGHSWWATKDHIQHRCRCCGYTWETLPLSKRKAVKS